MRNTKKLVIANWKMAPDTPKIAKEIFSVIKRQASKLNKIEVVICPPSIYLGSLADRAGKTTRLVIGAQDVFWENSGAFTGEISPDMIRFSGAKYVIVGHSERRALGETNEIVSQKVLAGIKSGLTVILCVGEGERDDHVRYLDVLKNQIRESLKSVKKSELNFVIIAYEPIWAISTAHKGAMLPTDLHEMVIFIRKVISDIYGQEKAMALSVLYGGSIDDENVGDLVEKGQADGILVGHNSLNPEEFNRILKVVNDLK